MPPFKSSTKIVFVYSSLFCDSNWDELVQKVRSIILDGTEAGILLSGRDGTGAPICDSSRIEANGYGKDGWEGLVLQRNGYKKYGLLDRFSVETCLRPYTPVICNIIEACEIKDLISVKSLSTKGVLGGAWDIYANSYVPRTQTKSSIEWDNYIASFSQESEESEDLSPDVFADMQFVFGDDDALTVDDITEENA